ncbi:MAG TPA: TetR/AcrR family transcriptional regulator [Symbiobacteriaceae bacterium]|nr:TetR/AcrR family transcriptional regulator [Symbiobacteriaceae bacterium]
MPAASTREEKRAAILNAALELFAERGYHATNVPLIAERAGISVGTLYHYFESKESVVNELYRKLKTESTAALWDDYPNGADPEEQFRTYWRRGAAYALAHPLAFAFLEMHHHAPYLDEESRTLHTRSLALEARLFRGLKQQGVLKDMPDPVLSAFIGGALVSLVKSASSGQIELTPAIIDQAAARCWAAIRNREKGLSLMNQFALKGEHGHVTIGFEPNTDGRATVVIENWNYRAMGKVWLSREQLAAFRDELQGTYKTLTGTARLTNTEGQSRLSVEVVFDKRGNGVVRGFYRETPSEENELRFSIVTDQSFVAAALEQLAEAVR